MKSPKALTALLFFAVMPSAAWAVGPVPFPPSKDNTLYEDPGGQLSNGQGQYLFAGKTGQTSENLRRGLIAFDLSSIPNNAIVTAATLSMYMSRPGGNDTVDISLSKALRDWGEGASNAGSGGGGGAVAQTGDATWLHTFYNTSFWTTPGGDYSPTLSATTTVSLNNTTYQWSSAGLLVDVQSWVSNPANNFGWVILGNEIDLGMAARFGTRENPTNPPQLNVTFQVPEPPTPTPTPFGTPSPPPGTPTPTSTPTPSVTLSGTVTYCSNPVPGPVPGATLSLTGTSSGSTPSDGSGNYTFTGLASGGSYTVTPAKAARTPGSAGINTVDVIAVQRHFLILGPPLTGCRLTAADCAGSVGINTQDVIAIQRFFLGFTTGIGNVGKYSFNPTNRTYTGLVTNQTAQNYDTLIFGDVATPFAD